MIFGVGEMLWYAPSRIWKKINKHCLWEFCVKGFFCHVWLEVCMFMPTECDSNFLSFLMGKPPFSFLAANKQEGRGLSLPGLLRWGTRNIEHGSKQTCTVLSCSLHADSYRSDPVLCNAHRTKSDWRMWRKCETECLSNKQNKHFNDDWFSTTCISLAESLGCLNSLNSAIIKTKLNTCYKKTK